MGKSSKKSNVEVAPDAVAVPPTKSAKKGGKRDSDQAIPTSTNAKKQKVAEIVPKKNGKKSKKVPIPEKKEPEISGSEDTTLSESEEEVKAPAKVANKPAKPTQKEVSSSEESESSDEEIVKKDVPTKKQPSTLSANGTKGNAKKEQLKSNAESDSDSEDDEDDEDEDNEDDESSADELPREQKNKPKVESNKSSNSEDDSSGESEEESEDEPVKKPKKKDEDVKMDDAPSKATGKQTATKSEKKGLQTPAGSQNEKSGSKTLFVGNLSYDVSEDDVIEFFKEAGEVIEVRMSQDADGRFKGFGHVEFADQAAAQRAIEMNGQELSGRAVKLDFARERAAFTPNSSKDDNSHQKSGKGQSQTIFVRGFDKNQEMDQIENSLKEYFGSCGEITRVSLPRDYESGGSKGIAYMDFKDQNALSKALELDGTELGDCALTVEEAKPRGDSRDGGGWSGGRGGRGGGGGRGGRRGGGRGGGGFGGRGGRGRGGGGRGRRN